VYLPPIWAGSLRVHDREQSYAAAEIFGGARAVVSLQHTGPGFHRWPGPFSSARPSSVRSSGRCRGVYVAQEQHRAI